MKLFYIFAFGLFSFSVLAQSSIDYSVQTWAEINTSAPKITVHWKAVNNANNYFVYKKEKTGDSWGVPIANIDDSITYYEDTDVVIGKSYEYQIKKAGAKVEYE